MYGVVDNKRKINKVRDTSQQTKYNIFSEKVTLFLYLHLENWELKTAVSRRKKLIRYIKTVTFKISGTIYEVYTICDGSELLYPKMGRLIKTESGKTSPDKKEKVHYNKIAKCLSGIHYKRNEHMTTTKNYSDNVTVLYARLSQENALDWENNSIANLKKILLKYAIDKVFPNPTFFIDDGVSSVTFNRPSWNEMINLTEAGKVKMVIVKDMSSMGRNYLKFGYYTDSFFDERDIRYITINDGVDNDKGYNELTSFRKRFHDFYTRDTSKKIRAVMRVKGNSSEHLCVNPPYWYRKNPDNKKK